MTKLRKRFSQAFSQFIHNAQPCDFPADAMNDTGAIGIALAAVHVEQSAISIRLARAVVDLALTRLHLDDSFPMLTEAGRASLLYGWLGVYLADARMALREENEQRYVAAENALISCSERYVGDCLDAVMGHAGVLTAVKVLMRDASARGIVSANLMELGDRSSEAITFALQAFVEERTTSDYLGFAHGTAGLLYALQEYCAVARHKVPDIALKATRKLVKLANTSDHGLYWTTRGDSGDVMHGWCHGNAGHIMNFVRTLRSFPDAGDIRDALKGANEHMWNASWPHLYDICCGLAGMAYAMLTIYRFEQSSTSLERAEAFAEAAMAMHLKTSSERGLFRGTAGIACLAHDLDWPELSRMPIYEY